jgi:predicted amidohydrolase
MTRIAVLQMCSGTDPAENTLAIQEAMTSAAEEGAQILFTPEMSLLLDRNRERAAGHVVAEESNENLATLRHWTLVQGIWLALGSMAVLRPDGRWANRSLLIDHCGQIVARYDKIHMFDVQLASGESWRESAAYVPGEQVVTAQTPAGKLGLSICYDLRFPALFQELGDQSCDLIATPAAFTVPTGQAHWHLLQRARAVEASAYVVAAAQAGHHPDGRQTYGHSLVVDPWGEVLLDLGGDGPALGYADIDPARIAEVRAQLPSLANRRPIPKSTRP